MALTIGNELVDGSLGIVERHAVQVNVRTHGELATFELGHRLAADTATAAPDELIGETHIEVFVGRLRRKIDPQGLLNPIETLRGRGYRLNKPAGSA